MKRLQKHELDIELVLNNYSHLYNQKEHSQTLDLRYFNDTLFFEKQSQIISFFKENNFKILKRFKKAKSHFRITQINMPLKFLNLLFKKGLKNRYNKIIINSFKSPNIKNICSNDYPWRFIFSIFLYFNPIFSFIISKADKKKLKNSRNKIKKYFFIWKYVPQYKRFRVFLKYFVKEVKFINQTKLKDRLASLFLKLFLKKNLFYTNFIQFSNKHIYYNLKSKVLWNYLESR